MADQYNPLPVKTKSAGDISANIQLGTITSVANVAAGTITRVEGGSIVHTAGTVTTG